VGFPHWKWFYNDSVSPHIFHKHNNKKFQNTFFAFFTWLTKDFFPEIYQCGNCINNLHKNIFHFELFQQIFPFNNVFFIIMVFVFNNLEKINFRLFHQSFRLIKYAYIQRYPSIILMTDHYHLIMHFINYLKSLISKDCLESEIKAS